MDLPKKYKPHDVEATWKDAWGKAGIYAWDPARPREETFVVDTPPPTVSGSLHLGHLFSYSHQDFIVRYQRMTGKNIFFPIGWDDNGLPTERRVQNLMNVKCAADVAYDPDFKAERVKGKAKTPPTPINRKNFIDLCGDIVVEDEEVFKALWTRLGLSYDWDQEYTTIDEHSRRISQYSFLKLLQDDEVYQAERPVLWDVDFQTAIAQAELTDKELPSAYNHLTFSVDGSDTKLVVATTRPELLPACVAVVVHPEDERYKHHIGEYAITPLFGVKVKIIGDTKADPEKGTGVVMVCTFGDQTDVEWWNEYKLSTRQILNREGHLLHITFGEEGWESVDPDKANAHYAALAGKYVKPARRIIIEEAEAAGDVIASPPEEITHAVKFFEKGDRPLELIPARQWYTRIMDHKEALIAQGKKIKWYPEFMEKRYEHWVQGLNQDWCMSRQRYFGVPIPLWYKIDEHGEVQYSERIIPSMDRLPVDPLADAPESYSEDQRNQPNGFSAESDIFDTWATSSLTPQISSHWFSDEDRHQKLYPADMRPQGHDIIRTWAFYTIAKAYLHDKEVPWQNITLSGWILDPDRKKMSKSQGNVVTPEPILDDFGADSVRYWAGRARLGVDTAHDESVFKVGKRLCMKMFNASKFVIQGFEDIDPALLGADQITVDSDRAAIAELRPLIELATKAFDNFDYSQALQLTEDFFWHTFCDNYIELAKPRTYNEDLSEERLSAASSLRLIHRALVRLFAPFVPFITDEVWHWAYSADADMHNSVHRSPWPSLEEFASVPEPCDAGTWNAITEVVDGIRKEKSAAQVSVKAPVETVTVEHTENYLAALAPALGDLMLMLEIDNVDMVPTPGATEVKVTIELKEVQADA
jgi:valyl-tRNA synthetase